MSCVLLSAVHAVLCEASPKAINMAPYVVGVDGGTEGIRAGVFDTQGNALAFASCAYETTFPQPGWAEQVRYLQDTSFRNF